MFAPKRPFNSRDIDLKKKSQVIPTHGTFVAESRIGHQFMNTAVGTKYVSPRWNSIKKSETGSQSVKSSPRSTVSSLATSRTFPKSCTEKTFRNSSLTGDRNKAWGRTNEPVSGRNTTKLKNNAKSSRPKVDERASPPHPVAFISETKKNSVVSDFQSKSNRNDDDSNMVPERDIQSLLDDTGSLLSNSPEQNGIDVSNTLDNMAIIDNVSETKAVLKDNLTLHQNFKIEISRSSNQIDIARRRSKRTVNIKGVNDGSSERIVQCVQESPPTADLLQIKTEIELIPKIEEGEFKKKPKLNVPSIIMNATNENSIDMVCGCLSLGDENVSKAIGPSYDPIALASPCLKNSNAGDIISGKTEGETTKNEAEAVKQSILECLAEFNHLLKCANEITCNETKKSEMPLDTFTPASYSNYACENNVNTVQEESAAGLEGNYDDSLELPEKTELSSREIKMNEITVVLEDEEEVEVTDPTIPQENGVADLKPLITIQSSEFLANENSILIDTVESLETCNSSIDDKEVCSQGASSEETLSLGNRTVMLESPIEIPERNARPDDVLSVLSNDMCNQGVGCMSGSETDEIHPTTAYSTFNVKSTDLKMKKLMLKKAESLDMIDDRVSDLRNIRSEMLCGQDTDNDFDAAESTGDVKYLLGSQADLSMYSEDEIDLNSIGSLKFVNFNPICSFQNKGSGDTEEVYLAVIPSNRSSNQEINIGSDDDFGLTSEECTDSHKVYAESELPWTDFKTEVNVKYSEGDEQCSVEDVWLVEEEDISEATCHRSNEPLLFLEDMETDWHSTEKDLEEVRAELLKVSDKMRRTTQEIKSIQVKTFHKPEETRSCRVQKNRHHNGYRELVKTDSEIRDLVARLAEAHGCSRTDTYTEPSANSGKDLIHSRINTSRYVNSSEDLSTSSDHLYTITEHYCDDTHHSGCYSEEPPIIIISSEMDDENEYFSVSSGEEDFDYSSSSLAPQKSYLSFGKSCTKLRKPKKGLFSFLKIFK